MKSKLLALAAVASLAFTAPAQAFVVDLEGLTANGIFDGFTQIAITNTDANEVIDISFNFVYAAGECTVCGDPPGDGNQSWGSELVLEVYHVDTDTAAQIGTDCENGFDFGLTCEADLGWDDASGVFTASGSLLFPSAIADGSGDWVITIADSFDDAGVDGQFLAGSQVAVNQAAPPAAVPVPATLLLIGVGLVGFGVARRRS